MEEAEAGGTGKNKKTARGATVSRTPGPSGSQPPPKWNGRVSRGGVRSCPFCTAMCALHQPTLRLYPGETSAVDLSPERDWGVPRGGVRSCSSSTVMCPFHQQNLRLHPGGISAVDLSPKEARRVPRGGVRSCPSCTAMMWPLHQQNLQHTLVRSPLSIHHPSKRDQYLEMAWGHVHFTDVSISLDMKVNCHVSTSPTDPPH